MKKFFALLLAAMMLLTMTAVATAEEAGFDEYELGVEGEQDVGFMTMAMVYFQPVDMAPVENATPKEGSDLHIEVDLTANENPYGFPVDSWVPYLSIDFSIKDLEGKAIGTGALGSTSGDAVPLLLDALGINVKSTANLSSNGICDALKDGTIDVGFGVTGVPASWMLDLETSKDIKIIPLSEDEINTVLAAQPYWSSGVIPGGVYKNHDEDIPCITFGNFFIANKDLDEDLVYNLVKATFEHKAEIEKVDKNAEGIDVENLGFLTMPLHPGAQRYYEEIGVEIPDNLKLD